MKKVLNPISKQPILSIFSNEITSISKEFKLNHNEIICESISKDELVSVIKYFDEPFGDSSALPTFLITKLLKKKHSLTD